MTLRRRDFLTTIGAASIATATGLGTVAADETRPGTVGDALQDARVRVAHFSPDAPDVDVYVAGDRVISGLSFRSITDYLTLSPGRYQVQITAAGDPDTVAFEGEVPVGDKDYTIAAIGELSEGSFRPLVLRDSSTPHGFASLRVVHASPDAPAVDVTVSNGQFGVFDGLEFGDVSENRLFGASDLDVEVRGATESGRGPIVSEATLDLHPGNAYTVFATGYLSPDDEPAAEPFRLVPAVRRPRGSGGGGENGRVRVAHLSPDAPAVDVFLEDDRAVSGLAFRSVTDYLTVPPGTYAARITPAGDPDTAVFEGDIPVDPGTAYTVAATGELEDGSFRPVVLTDDRTTENGRSRVRVVHASPDAPDVDVTVGDAETTLVDGLGFREDTDYLSVRPGDYELEVRPDSGGNDNPFDAEFAAPLRPGRTYTAFATGYFTTDDEPADEQFGLVLATDASG